MDDTNPENEDSYFTNMIVEMVDWLGYDYNKNVLYASDYFSHMYDLALKMIENNLAYVDFNSKEKITEMRGNLYTAGIRSEYANKPIEWHLFGACHINLSS